MYNLTAQHFTVRKGKNKGIAISMRHALIYMFALLIGIFAFGQVLNASELSKPAFFRAIPDLPIMDGLTELTDQTVIFDKAQGRIVELVVLVDSQFPEEVHAYYAEVLPQLGWTRITLDEYSRGGERLKLNFERDNEQQFLRISLSPK